MHLGYGGVHPVAFCFGQISFLGGDISSGLQEPQERSGASLPWHASVGTPRKVRTSACLGVEGYVYLVSFTDNANR